MNTRRERRVMRAERNRLKKLKKKLDREIRMLLIERRGAEIFAAPGRQNTTIHKGATP